MGLFKRKSQAVAEPAPVGPLSTEQADSALQEMAQLYRDRLRAIYNNDQSGLGEINSRISALKAKLGSDY